MNVLSMNDLRIVGLSRDIDFIRYYSTYCLS